MPLVHFRSAAPPDIDYLVEIAARMAGVVAAGEEYAHNTDWRAEHLPDGTWQARAYDGFDLTDGTRATPLPLVLTPRVAAKLLGMGFEDFCDWLGGDPSLAASAVRDQWWRPLRVAIDPEPMVTLSPDWFQEPPPLPVPSISGNCDTPPAQPIAKRRATPAAAPLPRRPPPVVARAERRAPPAPAVFEATVSRPQALACASCGTPIGARRPEEPRLCYKPRCRE